jgi:hypothetical protein
MPLHKGMLKNGFKLREVVKAADAPSVYDRLRDDPGSLFGVVFDWQ